MFLRAKARNIFCFRFYMRALLLSLALSTLACTRDGVVAGATGVQSLRASAPSSSVVIEGYGDVGPSANLTLRTSTGAVTAKASELCKTEEGLARKHERFGCAQPTLLARWDDIQEVKVEEFDGLTTVAVVAGSAIIVAAAVTMAVVASGAGSGAGSKAPREPAKPVVRNTTPSAPPASVNPRPVPPVRDFPRSDSGRRGGGGWSNGGGGTNVSVLVPLQNTGIVVLPGGGGSSDEPTVVNGPAPSAGAVPLIDESAARRAEFSPFARLGGSVCVARADCVAGGASLGVRFANLVEVSGGVLLQSGGPMGQVALGLQGMDPKDRWLALYVGAAFATDGKDMRVDPTLGFRLLPASSVTIGVLPLGFSYGTRTGAFLWAPSVDLTASF
jgi:hypothetical protein